MYKRLLYVSIIIANNHAVGMEWPEDYDIASAEFDLDILANVHEDYYSSVTNPAAVFNLDPQPVLQSYVHIPTSDPNVKNSNVSTPHYTNYSQQTSSPAIGQSQIKHDTRTEKNTFNTKPYLHTNIKSNEAVSTKPQKIITKKPVSTAEALLAKIMQQRYQKIDTQCCDIPIKSVCDMRSHIKSHHNVKTTTIDYDVFKCSNPTCKKCPYGALETAKCHFLNTHYPDMYKCPRKGCKTILSAYTSLRSHYLQKCKYPLPDDSNVL